MSNKQLDGRLDWRFLWPLSVLLVVGVILIARYFQSHNAWVCSDGQWLKRGQPSSPPPDLPCGETTPVTADDKQNEWPTEAVEGSGDLLILSPVLNETVQQDTVIKGRAKGTWFFEGSFPIEALTATGENIGGCVAQAQGEWMTEALVDFSCTLNLNQSFEGSGFLVFKKDNPSGEPQFDQSFKYPINFK